MLSTFIEFYDKFRGIDKENAPTHNLPFGYKNDKFSHKKQNGPKFSSFSMIKENRQSSDKMERDFCSYFKVTDF